MANLNYDSAGSGSYTTLTAAIAAVTAVDDTILALSTSSDDIATTTYYESSATYAPGSAGQKLYSVSSFSPTAITPGAAINFLAAYYAVFKGYWDIRGLKFTYAGSGTSAVYLGFTTTPSVIYAEDIILDIRSTKSGGHPLRLGAVGGNSSDVPTKTVINGLQMYFGNTNQGIIAGYGEHRIKNLSLISGSLNPTVLFLPYSGNGLSLVRLEDSDLSSWQIGSIVDSGADGQLSLFCNRIKLHASSAFTTGTVSRHVEITAVDCYIGTTFVDYYYANYAGTAQTVADKYTSVSDPTSLSDGTNPKTRKLTSNSTCGRSAQISTELLLPVSDSDSAQPWVEITSDTALDNSTFWIDVSITDSSGYDSAFHSTRCGVFDTPTGLSTGTMSWTSASTYTYKVQLPSSITVSGDQLIIVEPRLATSNAQVWVGAYGG